MTTDAADREPSARPAGIAGVAWALLPALVVVACDDGTANGVADAASDGTVELDVDSGVEDAANDLPEYNETDASSEDALPDATARDVVEELDTVRDAPSDVDSGGTPIALLVPTDWVPDGSDEWAQGPCQSVDVPDPVHGRGNPLQRVDVTTTGGCFCLAGACVEIPAGAVLEPIRLSAGYTVSADDGYFAVGPSVWFKPVDTETANARWDAFRPDATIRVAVEAYPSESLTVDAVRWRHEWYSFGFPESAWHTSGGEVAEGRYALEFTPGLLRSAPADLNIYRVTLSLSAPAENYCGDGVLGPHERCEKGDPANEGLCDIACQPQTWVHCEDGECISRCPRDFECADPGPCRVAECDSRVGCVWIPTDEGETCETDEVSGWCETGHCVETPRDCVECGVHRRWLDGQCRETEREYSWAPEPRLDNSRAEGGVFYARTDAGGPGLYYGTLALDSPELHLEHGWVDVEYRTEPGVEPFDGGGRADGDYFIDGLESLLPPSPGAWNRLRIGPETIDLRGGELSSFSLLPDTFVGADLQIRRLRYSELGLGICSVGVRHPDAEDGWAECVPRVGDAWCGDACVNLLYNRYNCGECGHVCDSDLFCEGGECVREPVWRDYVDTFPDDCPEGYFGLDCTGVCPGVAEDGIACSGNGLCHDGLWGNGHCYCHEDPAYGHGLNCEFSCDDGIRNGLEQNIDCGGGVCDPCEEW